MAHRGPNSGAKIADCFDPHANGPNVDKIKNQLSYVSIAFWISTEIIEIREVTTRKKRLNEL